MDYRVVNCCLFPITPVTLYMQLGEVCALIFFINIFCSLKVEVFFFFLFSLGTIKRDCGFLMDEVCCGEINYN